MHYTYIYIFIIELLKKEGLEKQRATGNCVGGLTHFCPPLRFRNQFLPTVPTFDARETNVSRHNGGTTGAPLKPLRDDNALRALSSLRGLRGAPAVPPLCRETQSLGQHMLELSCENATVGTNGLRGSLNRLLIKPRGVSLSDS